jgi:large subunit ribosomal protein L9
MNVILQEKVKNLGMIGDSVSVKSGYARNYLIPKGVAVMATPKNIASFETRRAEFEKVAAEKLEAAKAVAAKVAALTVTVAAKAGDEGKLFGSVGPREIAMAINAQGLEVSKADIAMLDGPIRHTGEFEVSVHLHMDITETLKVTVTESKD